MHYHLSPRLAVNLASDYRPCHHCCRHLNALEAREQVRHLAFRLASFAHFRNRFRQNRPAFPLPAHRHRQLSGMRVANLRARLRWCLALHAIPPEHLAPPVIGVPRLRHPYGLTLAFRTVSGFNHHVFQFRRLQILAILAILPLAGPTPLGFDYDSKGFTSFHPRNFAFNRPRTTSNWPQIALKVLISSIDRSVEGFWVS